MTTDLYNFLASDPTQVPASTIDATAPVSSGSPVPDWLSAGLSKALDVYAQLDIAHLNASQPQTGFYRVPGTNQVQPVGQPASGVAGISTGMILVGVAALALIFFVAKKA